MAELKFSDRVGATKPKSIIQIDSMDEELKNSLWNAYYIYIHSYITQNSYPNYIGTAFLNDKAELYAQHFWMFFCGKALDQLNKATNDFLNTVRVNFFKGQWYDVYNFIEFTIRFFSKFDPTLAKSYSEYTNDFLESNLSGYRIIDGRLSPISNVTEVKSIQTALQSTTKYNGAYEHLKKAIEKLSQKPTPDCNNCIKESISAVESLCKAIANDDKADLHKALDKIKTPLGLHGAQVQAFDNLYGYTSDEKGIRHAKIDFKHASLEDAQFMLISCSAFINYLIVKADKVGIKL